MELAGQGFLTGNPNASSNFDPKTDLRSDFPRFGPDVLNANELIIDFLRTFGAKKDATLEGLREIEAAFSRITVHGGRMNALQMSQIGQD